MAKGFKVKTVAPKVKAPEWDIDAIKARWKGKAIEKQEANGQGVNV